MLTNNIISFEQPGPDFYWALRYHEIQAFKNFQWI